jgi:hypothetical protein
MMITSSVSIRSTREWMPDDLPNPSFPGDDGGWMGQVPPPAPAKASPAPPVDDPVTGHETPQDARENGWLGQVPPPSPATPVATAAPIDDAVTGYENARDARENGWLGQVPPPTENRPEPARSAPTYANPQLAPEPWKSDPPNDWSDPTLFG